MFQETNKLIVFFNNKDTVGFIESCCGKGMAIQNEVIRKAMKKKTKTNKNRRAALSKLDKTITCLFFVCILL